jgi:RNA polymerase sigma factor FliA
MFGVDQYLARLHCRLFDSYFDAMVGQRVAEKFGGVLAPAPGDFRADEPLRPYQGHENMSSTDTVSATPDTETSVTNNQDLRRRYAKAGKATLSEDSRVEQYLPLVKTAVGRLAMTLPPHVNSEDLYSAGLMGLLHAVRHFDPNRGSSFESYARTRIRGAILDELRRLDWVPRSVHEKAKKVADVMQEVAQREGCIPTDEQMAQAMHLSLSDYEDLVEEIRPVAYVSLDSLQDSETGVSNGDVVPDERQADPAAEAVQRETARLIEEHLQQLPEMQRKVLALYYVEDLRLREIAAIFGVTVSRICQIHAKAILTLKALLKKKEQDAF